MITRSISTKSNQPINETHQDQTRTFSDQTQISKELIPINIPKKHRSKTDFNEKSQTVIENKQTQTTQTHEVEHHYIQNSKSKQSNKRKTAYENNDNQDIILIPNNEIIICATEIFDHSENMHTQLIIKSRVDFEITDCFVITTATELINKNTKQPTTIAECKTTAEWPQWKQAIASELSSLFKRGTFIGPMETPQGQKTVGCRWVFVKKLGDGKTPPRFKGRLVAQGFSQRPGLDFNETYSPVMDITSYRYLISLSLTLHCNLHIMDVVTAYLYGDLDKDIYMKVPPGVHIPAGMQKPCVKLVKSLYGLKQAGRMWYYRLAKFLKYIKFKPLESSPCIFVKGNAKNFVIISIYVDDLNLIGTENEINQTKALLNKEFEMKDLGEGSYCLGVEMERIGGGILIHQSLYIKNLIAKFNMEGCYPVNAPLQVRNSEEEKDIYAPIRPDEEPLKAECPYLSAIGSLLYLANTTRPDISFSVNFLARFSQQPTLRHWSGIKQIIKYLQGTPDTGLYYKNENNNNKHLVGYADAGYVSDPTTGQSQTGYVFMSNSAAISWRSVKQTTVATSTNHAEIIALYEASRECVWLRNMITEIRQHLGISTKFPKTTIYEDNAACVAQVTGGYIRTEKTKHLSTKLFWTNQKTETEINVCAISSAENIADLLTKSLHGPRHQELCVAIGLRSLKNLQKTHQQAG
jgi:Reverse transcriptase (RNA-dependent DNA polymerase)